MTSCATEDGEVVSGGPGGKADDYASFEEFKASLYCEPDGGACIVMGDIPIFGDEALRALFEQGLGSSSALTVMREDSVDAVWDRTTRFNLTYCVSSAFGDRHAEVVSAMLAASADWQQFGHVTFRYLSEHDGNCNTENDDVLFDVSPAPQGARYFARAFFPNDKKRAQRQVLIDLPSIDDSLDAPTFGGRLSLRGILRHELGHTLGFRHEHIRPENGWNYFCREDENFRPLTEYDKKSVMHYPQCDGEGDWSLELTLIDQQGVRFFYPDFDRFKGERCTIEIRGTGAINDDCAPIVHEILELANTASFDILDNWVGLDVRAVEELVGARATAPFNELQQLRDVTYLGEAAVRGMYEYLYVDGRCPIEVDNEGRVDTLCRPVVHRVLELANLAPFEELDDDVRLDRRAAENIVERRAEAPFTDLSQLWAVSYVKTRALRKMYEYIYGE